MKPLVFLVASLLCVNLLVAQENSLSSPPFLKQQLTPLDRYLTPDGRLNTPPDFKGSLDPTGWEIATGRHDEPRFVPVGENTFSDPADTSWDDGFAYAGLLGGEVNAMVVSGTDLYVGGSFSTAGATSAAFIAKWNGTSWSALGSGMNAQVTALAVIGTDIYAGGHFTQAGGSTINHVAKWNGTSWSGLGSGVNGTVWGLAAIGTNLYAAGSFGIAGGGSASHIAKWNGSSWSALGSGLNSNVYALAAIGSDLYAGGGFDSAGGTSAIGIAKWNGTTWSSLGLINGGARAFTIIGTDLYAGGGFTIPGGGSAISVAKWNGTAWSALGSAIAGSGVRSLAAIGTDLYAGGVFTTQANIAKWNGTSWVGLGSGMNNSVEALAVIGTDLYAGGPFTTAGGTAANYMAKWNGASWLPLLEAGTRNGMNSNVSAIAVIGTDVYAGGSFTTAGGTAANYIAKWNGTNWSTLGSGMNAAVSALFVIGTDLFAGGLFTTAGGISANYIAKWNGTSWSALGSGMNSYVYSLAVIGTDLYAGGNFSTAGGTSANRIAKWNGTSWSALGSGMNEIVFALAAIGTDLYAGGSFTTAGGTVANRIAKWNGTSWSALGTGMTNIVWDLAVIGTDLFAGGSFTSPGNRIARWNGTSWSSVSGGANGIVYALTVFGTTLYAGGAFVTMGSSSVEFNGLARWNESTNWRTFGSGLNDEVTSLAVTSSNLYAGGSFSAAGEKPSGHIGRWTGVLAAYSIFVYQAPNGSVTPYTTEVNHGDDKEFVFTPNIGYHVDSIIVDGVYAGDSSSYRFINVTSSHSISVRFAINTYTVIATTGPHGAISPAGTIVMNAYTDTTFTFTPNIGYHVDSIVVDGTYAGDSSSYRLIDVLANHNVMVKFAFTTHYIITATATMNGAISPAGSTVVPVNGDTTFTFTPNIGYHVDSIIVDGAYAGDSLSYHFAGVTANRSIHVVFAPNPATFLVSSSSLSFGEVFIGASEDDSVTVSNNGGLPLSISSISSNNPEFSYSTSFSKPFGGLVVPPGGSAVVLVTFTPASAGVKSGKLSFVHDAAGSPDTVDLDGEGYGLQLANEGWNLLSVPLEVADYRTSIVYPTASSPAYHFAPGLGYQQRDTLVNGEGIWIKFPSNQPLTIDGTAIPSDTIPVFAGWNLVGSVSQLVPVASVGAIGTSILTPFYSYAGAYASADPLVPGMGYWVKVSQAGSLVIGSATVPPARLQEILQSKTEK